MMTAENSDQTEPVKKLPVKIFLDFFTYSEQNHTQIFIQMYHIRSERLLKVTSGITFAQVVCVMLPDSKKEAILSFPVPAGDGRWLLVGRLQRDARKDGFFSTKTGTKVREARESLGKRAVVHRVSKAGMDFTIHTARMTAAQKTVSIRFSFGSNSIVLQGGERVLDRVVPPVCLPSWSERVLLGAEQNEKENRQQAKFLSVVLSIREKIGPLWLPSGNPVGQLRPRRPQPLSKAAWLAQLEKKLGADPEQLFLQLLEFYPEVRFKRKAKKAGRAASRAKAATSPVTTVEQAIERRAAEASRAAVPAAFVARRQVRPDSEETEVSEATEAIVVRRQAASKTTVVVRRPDAEVTITMRTGAALLHRPVLSGGGRKSKKSLALKERRHQQLAREEEAADSTAAATPTPAAAPATPSTGLEALSLATTPSASLLRKRQQESNESSAEAMTPRKTRRQLRPRALFADSAAPAAASIAAPPPAAAPQAADDVNRVFHAAGFSLERGSEVSDFVAGFHMSVPLSHRALMTVETDSWVDSDALFDLLLLRLNEHNTANPQLPVAVVHPLYWAPRYRQREPIEFVVLRRMDFQLAVVPLHVYGFHWMLAVIDLQNMAIMTYDSASNGLSQDVRRRLLILASAMAEHRGIRGNFTIRTAQNAERSHQPDGNSCGIFTYRHAFSAVDSLTRDRQSFPRLQMPSSMADMWAMRRAYGLILRAAHPSAAIPPPAPSSQNRAVDSSSVVVVDLVPLTPRHEARAKKDNSKSSAKRQVECRARKPKIPAKTDIKIRPGRTRDAPFNIHTYKPDPNGLRSSHLQPTKHKSASAMRYKADKPPHCAHVRAVKCQLCETFLFPGETRKLCCSNGAANTENVPDLLQFSDSIKSMFDRSVQAGRNLTRRPKDLQSQSILLNSLFQMISLHGNRRFQGNGEPVVIVEGRLQYNKSSILPMDGHPPVFAQIYAIDGTDGQTDARIQHLASFSGAEISRDVIHAITEFLMQNNELAQSFLLAKDAYTDAVFRGEPIHHMRLVLLSRAEMRRRIHRGEAEDRDQARDAAAAAQDLHDRQLTMIAGVSAIYRPADEHDGPAVPPKGTYFAMENDGRLRHVPYWDENVAPLTFPLIHLGGEKGFSGYLRSGWTPGTGRLALPKPNYARCPLCGKKGGHRCDVRCENDDIGEDEAIAGPGNSMESEDKLGEVEMDEENDAVLDFDYPGADLHAPEVAELLTAADYAASDNTRLAPREIDEIHDLLDAARSSQAAAEDQDALDSFVLDDAEEDDEPDDEDQGEIRLMGMCDNN